jgi:hypothetical protein
MPSTFIPGGSPTHLQRGTDAPSRPRISHNDESRFVPPRVAGFAAAGRESPAAEALRLTGAKPITVEIIATRVVAHAADHRALVGVQRPTVLIQPCGIVHDEGASASCSSSRRGGPRHSRERDDAENSNRHSKRCVSSRVSARREARVAGGCVGGAGTAMQNKVMLGRGQQPGPRRNFIYTALRMIV